MTESVIEDRQPTAAILVIGDEILSGRTQEGNAHFLAGVLTEIGVALRQIRCIPDDEDTIIAAVRELSAQMDYVF
ncbi:MAG: molybdopterin-binding protein, partial [Pseudomonadota bacterium]